MKTASKNFTDQSFSVTSTTPKAKGKKFYFIYGNHGDFPIQQEDYFFLLKDFLYYCLDKPLLVSEAPVSGHWNILFENFNNKDVDEIKKIKGTSPETHFICIATEFRTGNTFNFFGSEDKISSDDDYFYKYKIWFLSILDGFLRRSKIIDLLKVLPFSSYLKKYYKKNIFDKVGDTHYSNHSYWKKRYDSFINALPYFDQVWTVTPNQCDGYRSIIESNKLWQLPIIPYIDKLPEPTLSKIFFL